jgi:phenylpropionate dioxygenase-like ring-hydroxylating dioxygenase large terminal subunit
MFLSITSDLNSGEVKPLTQFQNKKFLVNDNGTIKVGNNICPHQGSRIISGPTDNIKCQYHAWSWDIKGNPTGSGTTQLCNNKRLSMNETYIKNGFVFDKDFIMPKLPISLNGFELVEHRIDSVRVSDPRHIMNIFLDVDHIPIVHKNVYDKTGIVGDPDVEWEIFDQGSIQKVYRSDTDSKPLAFVWIAVYPYTMIEWQQGSMFITQMIKHENGVADVAVFKYKNTSSTDWKIDESTWETAWSQDRVQAEQMAVMMVNRLEDPKLHYMAWTEKNGIDIQ